MLWRVSRLLDPVEQGEVSNEPCKWGSVHVLELSVPRGRRDVRCEKKDI